MRRMSNLAFNQEFPSLSGMTGLKAESPVVLKRDRKNPFDTEAVGVFLDSAEQDSWPTGACAVPLGWLYRKDTNRPAVLQALDQGKILHGRIVLRPESVNRRERQKAILFWL